MLKSAIKSYVFLYDKRGRKSTEFMDKVVSLTFVILIYFKMFIKETISQSLIIAVVGLGRMSEGYADVHLAS